MRQAAPVSIKVIVQELYPNTPRSRLWMAQSNVEVLFRKFVAEGAAIAYRGEQRVHQLPSGYHVRAMAVWVWRFDRRCRQPAGGLSVGSQAGDGA